MKGALLEWSQLRPVGVAPRALREDKHILAFAAHLLGRALERFERICAIAPIDEHGTGEGHEPSEERDALEARFGRDGSEGRENGAEEEHIQLGLMVAHDHARPPRVEIFFARHDLEPNPRGQIHGDFERAGHQVLHDPVVAERPEKDRGQNAVNCANDETAVGGEESGKEGCSRNGHG